MTQSGDDAEALFRDAEGFFVPAGALHRVVGLAVAEGDYPQAQHLLSSFLSDPRDVPPEQWVSVAPGVLGVSLDGDDEKDVPEVAEHGNLLEPGQLTELGVAPGEETYTPSVSDVEMRAYGAIVGVDTDGVMFSAMGRTMLGILLEALSADSIPAHITGHRPDLRFWPPPTTGD